MMFRRRTRYELQLPGHPPLVARFRNDATAALQAEVWRERLGEPLDAALVIHRLERDGSTESVPRPFYVAPLHAGDPSLQLADELRRRQS